MHTLMLVDDEEYILRALKRTLGRYGELDIETYVNPHDALKRARTKNFDLFLSDYRMPDMDGVALLTELKELQPESMRLILSGYTDLEALIGAINRAEIYRFITKPWQDYELYVTIKQALQYRDMMLENRLLADQIREQRMELNKRKSVLDRYKEQHPELFKIEWSPDGSIVLDAK